MTPREEWKLKHRIARTIRREMNETTLNVMYGGAEARNYYENKARLSVLYSGDMIRPKGAFDLVNCNVI